MDLMDLQKKAIYATAAEGPIEPAGFAAKFSLDPAETTKALADLKQQGFMQEADGRFSLTAKGEALLGGWGEHEAAPVRRTTWQYLPEDVP
jgi:Mn-dependent DtxR family transcriptional regulator